MWYRILPQILSMSLTGSMVILFVLLARLALKNAPKIFSYVLWGVVLIRLLCPTAPASPLSLLNLLPDGWHTMHLQSDADQYIQSYPEYIVDPGMMSRPIVSLPDANTDTGHDTAVDITDTDSSDTALNNGSYIQFEIIPSRRLRSIHLGTVLWLGGILVLLAYSLHSLQRLRRQLDASVPLLDNIYLADHITTPFVLGLFRPRIYLPSSLPEEQMSYVLLHERHHIRRLDHVWKLMAFAALCIHWFNPLVWLAFLLAGKDMEMSCDEAVLRRLGDGIRADYSASLLSLSTGRRIYAAMPLAFGEGDTKDRIHHVLSWKRPRTWIIITAVIACLFLAVTLLTDPDRLPDFAGARYTVKEMLYDAPQYSFTYTVDTAPEFTITSDYVLLSRDQAAANDGWQSINGLYQVDYSRQELYALFDPLYCTAHERLDQVVRIYRAEPFNVSASVFYLVMQTKNGDIMLAQGYGRDGEENQHVRWLFLLEKHSGSYDLDHMRQILKETYGEDTEYFSLYQCDTQLDTILLGFQVGTGNAKGPSAVGYAAFRYDKTADDYLLAHSEILGYQITGLYPVKLQTLDNEKVNLQLIISTRKDLSAVKVSSPLKDNTDFEITQNVIGGPGGPSMLMFECPDELTLNTLNIQYVYEETQTHSLDNISGLSSLHFYMIPENSKEKSIGIPALTLQSGHQFQFSYDMLSSYLPHGIYMIQDNILTAITYDGRNQYRFEIIDDHTLRFLQEGSTDVSLIDERMGVPITDGAIFVTSSSNH